METTDRHRKITFASIGCRTNQEEIERVAASFQRSGFQIVKSVQEAEITILNTCCVTSKAAAKSRRMIKKILKSGSFPVVTGCMAQLEGEGLSESENMIVADNTDKYRLPEIILSEYYNEDYKGEGPDKESVMFLPPESSRSRFLLKIQEGCSNRCSYCIVPLMRGNSRSLDPESIMMRAENAVTAGYKELVLTGTHIGKYRKGERDLAALLTEISEITGDFRIRLSSLDPDEFNEGIAEHLSENPRVCRHLHLSIQSFSEEVLSAMNRKSDISHISGLISRVRERAPELALGCDIITGFPGETEEMFRKTLQGVKSQCFAYGHVFRFSPRPGTPAAGMKDDVPSKAKQRRSKDLKEQLREQRKEFLWNSIGRLEEVVVERLNPASGVTSNYIRVVLDDDTGLSENQKVDVRLTQPDYEDMSICGVSV
ncbi:MAG: tRNA (N(6)-L-threonylcarbamoyladenosine(37)-C(2))-methylthiotransferase MtaB [Chitinivibrionales bacterium]